MIVAKQMQDAVDEQDLQLLLQRVPPPLGLASSSLNGDYYIS